MEKHLLKINLISAQGPKPVNGRKLQTYAIERVGTTTKLRTQVDRVGGENPAWIDKFIFCVTEAFLASDTSAVFVEIDAVGYIKDSLVGTVHFLINNSLHSTPAGIPGHSVEPGLLAASPPQNRSRPTLLGFAGEEFRRG